jgi:hypothetical protein
MQLLEQQMQALPNSHTDHMNELSATMFEETFGGEYVNEWVNQNENENEGGYRFEDSFGNNMVIEIEDENNFVINFGHENGYDHEDENVHQNEIENQLENNFMGHDPLCVENSLACCGKNQMNIEIDKPKSSSFNDKANEDPLNFCLAHFGVGFDVDQYVWEDNEFLDSTSPNLEFRPKPLDHFHSPFFSEGESNFEAKLLPLTTLSLDPPLDLEPKPPPKNLNLVVPCLKNKNTLSGPLWLSGDMDETMFKVSITKTLWPNPSFEKSHGAFFLNDICEVASSTLHSFVDFQRTNFKKRKK